jgi:spermidine/putrescine transport system substrate-binding protein
VVYPEEGMGFGIDCVFVPFNAPNKDNAHSFINYILDGQVGADITSQIYYVCPNQAAAEFLPEELKNNPSINIPADVLGDTEFIEDVGEATEIYDRIWTRFIQE